MFDPLQNIFLGEDIRKQLPRESADFDDVNAKWKVIMTRLNKDRNALRGTHHEGKEQIYQTSLPPKMGEKECNSFVF